MISKNILSAAIANQRQQYEKSQTYPRAGLAEMQFPVFDFVQIVTGIRRCGKSTLSWQVMQNYGEQSLYVKFDVPSLYGFDFSDFCVLDSIIEELGVRSLFLDEIQIVNGWETYVLGKLDSGYSVVVTGSNATMLSRELGTRLTGRHLDKTLYPFSYSEYLGFTRQKVGAYSLKKYMLDGGFPEYLKKKEPSILEQLVDDILYRDIVVRYNIRSVLPLQRLALYLMSNVGNLISANSAKVVAGLKASQTVADYCSYMEDSYLFAFVPKFSYSYKIQQLNPRKVYCVDLGLQNVVSPTFTQDVGHRLENLVYLHLLRQGKQIYYFSEQQHECDFVACDRAVSELSMHIKPSSLVQVCAELTHENQEREYAGLLAAMEYFGQKSGVIVTMNEEDVVQVQDKRIEIVPAWKYVQ